ncbi:MAG: transposase [Betaproteobacteria bacterium]|nr:transposase [Betaproteobacteria bacterium]
MAQRVEPHPLEAAFAALPTYGPDGAGEAPRPPANGAGRTGRNRFLKARPHERAAGRTGYANGFKPKTMMARVGEPAFDVPQVGGGGFYPSALEKGSRTGQALDIALAEMYVRGVSARKAIAVPRALPGPEVPISPTPAGRAAEQPDAGLAARRERPPDETPHVFLDARYGRVREGGQPADRAVPVAAGVAQGGHRRVPGVSAALSGAEVHWRAFPDSLVRRGLEGVKTTTPDARAGPGAARRATLPGVPRRRCQFHLRQNARPYVARPDQRKPAARRIRAIFGAPDRTDASCDSPSKLGGQRRQSLQSGLKKICPRASPPSISSGRIPRSLLRIWWAQTLCRYPMPLSRRLFPRVRLLGGGQGLRCERPGLDVATEGLLEN